MWAIVVERKTSQKNEVSLTRSETFLTGIPLHSHEAKARDDAI